jgi:hypothetical protein
MRWKQRFEPQLTGSSEQFLEAETPAPQKRKTKMSFTPEDSRIKVTKSLEQLISEAQSQAEVQSILRDAAKSQGVVRPDAYDPNVLLEVEQRQPQKYAKAVTDAQGRKLIFEGATELEVEQRLGEYFRSLNLARPDQSAATTPTEQPRGTDGRFTTDDPTARIESDLVSRALESQGISTEALRDFTAKRETQSWASAVAEFTAQAEARRVANSREELRAALGRGSNSLVNPYGIANENDSR